MFRAKLTVTALAAAGVIGLGAPAGAAPGMSGAAALKQSVNSDVEQVRWRGGGRTAAAAGIGFATGAIVGGALASANRGYYSGGPYGYYDGYGGAYAYAPGYYAGPTPRFYNRFGGACDYVDSSGVSRFDNC